MTKYIQTQARKTIHAAGVGALIEDIKGVVKIKEFDKWGFYEKWDDNHYIKDKRLLQRLKDKRFPKLKALVKAPINKYDVISAEYFPKWMFCSKCHRFKHLKDWWGGWHEVIKQYDRRNMNNVRDSFIPPKCGYCYEEAKSARSKKQFYELTQTRFIMTSSDGQISDVPWEKWLTFKQQAKRLEDETVNLNNWGSCCDNQDLYYRQGDFEDLSGINIKCKACGKSSTLSGLYGLVYASSRDKQHKFKPAIRSSNSVYYPILAHSLYLPNSSCIDENDQSKIDRWTEKGKDSNFIFEALEECYTKKNIQDYIKDKEEASPAQKDIAYRRKEHQFILENEYHQQSNFIFKHQNIGNLDNITHLVQVSRLKMTTVQTGYTRQEPLDIDLFLEGNADRIKPRYTSSHAKNTEYLLGVENFGEGIFIAFNRQKIAQYIKKYSNQLDRIFKQSKASSTLFKNKFNDVKHLAKFIFVHTMSHLLMKELEFSCGYPTASLSERLFVDNKGMQAALIYTVGGMEGSYGGLASQAVPQKFEQLCNNALERAKDCASDPICQHSDGQGVGKMNLAACYSCALIADNACESFNTFLDRSSWI